MSPHFPRTANVLDLRTTGRGRDGVRGASARSPFLRRVEPPLEPQSKTTCGLAGSRWTQDTNKQADYENTEKSKHVEGIAHEHKS